MGGVRLPTRPASEVIREAVERLAKPALAGAMVGVKRAREEDEDFLSCPSPQAKKARVDEDVKTKAFNMFFRDDEVIDLSSSSD